MIGVLHPHTGSCVQTRDEVYAVMNAVDTRVLMLGRDIGELAAGGADPLPIAGWTSPRRLPSWRNRRPTWP